MKATELSRDELSELKQAYVCSTERNPSWDDIVNADSIPDETIFKFYAGTNFTKGDFMCDDTD